MPWNPANWHRSIQLVKCALLNISKYMNYIYGALLADIEYTDWIPCREVRYPLKKGVLNMIKFHLIVRLQF